SAVEVDIRIKFAFYEVLILKGHFFQFLGDVEHRVLDTKLSQHAISSALDNFSPRIEVLVHPVSESHQAEWVILIFCFIDPLLDVTSVFSDVFEHHDYFLIGATVERPPEGVYTCRNGSVDAGPRGTHNPNRGGGAVLLVIGV